MSFDGILGIRQSDDRSYTEPLSSARSVLGETFRETLETNPLAASVRQRELELAQQYGRRIAADEARSRLKEAGLDTHLTVPDQGISDIALEILMERKQTELKRAEVFAASPGGLGLGAAQFGVGFAASLVDPINIATAFIPVIGEARYANWLKSAGTGLRGAVGRTGIRAGVGTAEGFVGSVAVEPFIYQAKMAEQADYDAVDSLYNIAFGSVFGGGLHVIGGGAADIYRTSRGLPAIEPALIAPRPGAEPGVAGRAPAEPLAPRMGEGAAAVPPREPVVVYHGSRTQFEQFDPTLGSTPGSWFTASRADAEQFGDVRAVEIDVRNPASMAEFAEARREVAASGLDPVADPVAFNRAVIENLEARGFDGVNDPRFGGAGGRGADVWAAFRPEQIRQLTPDEVAEFEQRQATAAATMARVKPETREAALRTAVAQAVTGREVDVDAVVNMDPARRAAAADDPMVAAQAAAERNATPEAAALVDQAAAAEVPAPGPRAPVLDEAQAALDEAMAEADRVAKLGDEAYKYSRAAPSADRPGVGVEQKNRLGFEPALRVKPKLPKSLELPEKPLLLTGTNNANAGRQIDAIDKILAKFPKAAESPDQWSRMLAYAFASDEVPAPPYAFIRDVNGNGAEEKLAKLTKGQIADADHGFEAAAEFRKAYTGKELDVVTTGKLFLWSFLSRGVSPYVQESLFIDAFPGIDQWIRKAADGELTEADFPEYEAWAKSVAPKGSGQPGAGATHNLNAFGKLFLFKMSQKGEDGRSHLQKLHDMMEDPASTGQQIRREFMRFGEGVGIDNKVVSFTLLVAGFDDVMVIDRVQVRQLWDDGRFSDINLYDGRTDEAGKQVAGSAMAEITYGARGLLIYEAIERALQGRVKAIYKALGREEAGSVGRYHWETWVAYSQQEASHGTLEAILKDAKGNDQAIAQVTAKQGEYGAYEYGARYGRDVDGGAFFAYATPSGQTYEFSVPAFRAFLDDIKKAGTGVVPGKFKVTESGNAPWYTRREVNRERLDEVAAKWADRRGGTGEGARLVQEAGAREAVPDRAGSGQAAAEEVARYSRGAGVSPAEQITQIVRQSFGEATDTLLKTGRIQIVDEVGQVPGGPHPDDVRAVYAPDGTTYIVAANMPADMVRGVVLHEIGVHAGMEEMLGTDLWRKTLDELDRLAEAGDEAVLAARAMVPQDTPAGLVREETLAYLVQSAPEMGLVRRVLAAIKAWIYKLTGGKLGELGEAEFVALAESALRRQARERLQAGPEPAMAYARGANRADTSADELKPFDEAIKRAEVYATAVRAAAERIGDDDAARAAMRAATSDKLSAAEIDQLLDLLKTENRKVRAGLRQAKEQFTAEDQVAELQDRAMQAADQLANNVQLDATIEKRNAALSLAARTKAVGRILNEFAANPKEGLMALLGGSQFAKQGSKDSVFHWQRTFFTRWTKGMLYELERDGLAEAFVRNAYDQDVAKALYQLGRENPDLQGLAPEAVKIAQIVYKYREDARNTRNRYGAWIRQLTGYITRQTHDFVKIRAAGPEEWKAFVRDRLDFQRMEMEGPVEASLQGLYEDFAAGRHMAPLDEEVAAMTTPGSLARRVSQSRVLYFKDAASEFEYLKRFGVGKLHEAILGDLSRAAQQAGLLRVLGPNPEDTLRRVMDEVEESMAGDPVKRRAFYESRGQAEALLTMLDGRANIPGSHLAARVGAGVRAWQAMAKLGSAVVSAVTDLPVYASQIRYQGRGGLLSGVADGIGRLLQGRPKGEQRQILGMIDSVADGMIGGIAARFDSDDLMSGNTAELMRIFFRYNGLQWWTDTLREGMELGTANWLAGLKGQAWDQVDDEAKRLMTQYGLGAAEWDVIRQGSVAAADGRTYLTPEALRDVPLPVMEAYLRGIGRTVSDAGIANARRDLGDKLRNLIIDQAMTAVIEPDVRSRYIWTRGSRPGTFLGETMRLIAQFKGFPTAFTRQIFGREIYGRGYDSLGDYMRNGKGDMLGLAQMIVAMSVFGYAAMAAKDMLKGRTPRDPVDPKTWLSAMLQAGALGIYGDFILGQSNRFGRNVLDTLAGPALGTIGDLDELRQRAMRGDDVASSAFRLLVSNTPFLNLFYTRTALDYLILYRIQEALNPGSLRRMERRLERENGQEYLLAPSEVVN